MKHGRKLIIVCLVLLALGAACIGVGLAKGGNLSFSVDLKNRRVETGSDAPVQGVCHPNAPEQLVIRVDVADVTVRQGDAWAVEYSLGAIPTITEENSVFTIREAPHKSELRFWFDLSRTESKTEVIVTVPSAVSLDLEVDVGDVLVEGVMLKDAKLTLDVGALTLRDVQAETLSTAVSTGDTAFHRVTVSGDAALQNDIGDLTLTDLTAASITAENDIGDIAAALPGAAGDYAVLAETDIGEVTVDGAEMGRHYQTEGAVPVTLRNDTGDISIRFSN